MNRKQQLIYQRFKRYQELPKEVRAWTGNSAGVVRVPNRPYHIYARLWSGELIEAFNDKVQAIPDRLISVVYMRGSYQVLGYCQIYDDQIFTGLPDGAQEQLQWPSPGALFVRGEQFLPGLVLPAGSLSVRIYGTMITTADGHRQLQTLTYDLSEHVPSSGACYVLCEFSLTGDVLFTDGTTQSSRLQLTPMDIPIANYGSEIAAIILEAGQAEIKQDAERQDIIDLRFFRVNRGGQDVVLSTAEFDKILSSVDDTVQKAFNTLDEHTHGIPTSTALNNFQVGSGSGTWIKKTLAEVISILRTVLDGVYAALSHTHAASAITSGTLDGSRLPAMSESNRGGVPATGTPSGKYLTDGGWITSTARWEPVTNGDPDNPEFVFSNGDIVMSEIKN